MSEKNAVVWSEGMFLKPQHFQQQERFFQNEIATIKKMTNVFQWGIYNLDIDSSMLKLGQVSVKSAEGVFQDNTLFQLPSLACTPSVITVNGDVTNELVYLCIPVSKMSGIGIADKNDALITRHYFYDQNALDLTVGKDSEVILQVAQINTYLKLENEDRSGYLSFALARIINVSEENGILLDAKYIPPCLSVNNIENLKRYISEIYAMINQRAEVIANRLTQGKGASTSIVDFLMLQLLNKYQPIFDNFQTADGLHPEELFRVLTSFAGELCTFTRPEKRSPGFLQYNHEKLSEIFTHCMFVINHGLSSVLEQTAVQLPLKESQYGINVAQLMDKKLLEKSDFILALKASMPAEDICRRLPDQIKIGSVETIRELVNNQLTGVAVVNLPVAPRQVPYHTGYQYFQLIKDSVHWDRLKNSGGIALHLSGNYPSLKMELWAINKE
ncbi:MAG: type VI secretion system baseplate subunit TssK [Psychromonas sp.]|nr:type VI secretion system baseplate subunit TssK [Psychromonas sp.]